MYLKRYYNYFDPRVSKFVTADLIREEIEEKYNDQIIELNKEDRFYPIKLNSLKPEPLSSLEVAENFERKRNKGPLNLVDFAQRKDDAFRNHKVKGLIDFDEESCSSIKSLKVQKDMKINLTTMFLNGKMLMFSKISIKSFVYDLIDVFVSPKEKVTKIYNNYKIQKCFLFQNLTDTDSTSAFFVFISELSSSVDKRKAREIIFKVMIESKIFERLDLPDDFGANLTFKIKC